MSLSKNLTKRWVGNTDQNISKETETTTEIPSFHRFWMWGMSDTIWDHRGSGDNGILKAVEIYNLLGWEGESLKRMCVSVYDSTAMVRADFFPDHNWVYLFGAVFKKYVVLKTRG